MEDDLAASIDLAIELGAVAARGKTLSVVLRAFGAAVHEIAQDASIDLSRRRWRPSLARRARSSGSTTMK